ncbi:MAG: hypothetical protein ABSG46_06540 [Candidatus Binataceae bacterium]
MKSCLDEDRLLALMPAEPDEDASGRAHLARCATCAGRYRQLVRDTELIARTLEATASAAMEAEYGSKAPSRMRRYGLRFERPLAIASVAAAFAGGLAIAYVLIPGVHHSHSGSMPPIVMGLVSPAPATRNELSAADSLYMLWEPDQSDVMMTDPADDIGYHEAVAGDSNSGDMFLCVPQDDGAFCSSSAEQG